MTLSVPWVPAMYYQPGRGSYPLHFIVIHSVESPLQNGLAVSLAQNYFATTACHETSAHAMFDPIGGVEMVHPYDTAWHCGNGNQGGYGIEHTGYAAFTRDQWMTPAGMAMMKQSAQWAAQICAQYGIPAHRLTDSELASRSKGFCEHADVTRVLGGTTHTDPGGNFPLNDVYLPMVQSFLNGGTGGSTGTVTPPVVEDNFMSFIDNQTEFQAAFTQAADFYFAGRIPAPEKPVPNSIAERLAGRTSAYVRAGGLVDVQNRVTSLEAQAATILATVKDIQATLKAQGK